MSSPAPAAINAAAYAVGSSGPERRWKVNAASPADAPSTPLRSTWSGTCEVEQESRSKDDGRPSARAEETDTEPNLADCRAVRRAEDGREGLGREQLHYAVDALVAFGSGIRGAFGARRVAAPSAAAGAPGIVEGVACVKINH